MVIGALAAGLSGYLLPWDQLALAPIRPGQYRGYAFLFGHKEVHFVLIGSTEVAKATVRAWFFGHTVVVPLVLVALGVVGWRVTRRRRLAPVTDEDGSARPAPCARRPASHRDRVARRWPGRDRGRQ
ncbi:MAG: hypothetical protein JO086_11920 [Acidimicrobiia bacterium]|nr:hypothetical protein [Acidimicrobiia bacterium]